MFSHSGKLGQLRHGFQHPQQQQSANWQMDQHGVETTEEEQEIIQIAAHAPPRFRPTSSDTYSNLRRESFRMLFIWHRVYETPMPLQVPNPNGFYSQGKQSGTKSPLAHHWCRFTAGWSMRGPPWRSRLCGGLMNICATKASPLSSRPWALRRELVFEVWNLFGVWSLNFDV